MLRFNNKRRFTNSQRPPRFLSQREQWRLFMMLFALMFVIWSAVQVRKPERWNWLWNMTQPSAPTAPAPVGPALVGPAPVAPAKDLEAGERASHAAEKTVDVHSVSSTNRGFFPGVDVEYLRMVEDNKVFRRTGESAWLNLLEVLQTNEQTALEAASTGGVTYTQLQQQPAQYRGQLVTLQGMALRCLPKKAIQNDLGLETLYQIVFRAEGGANQTILIYVLDLPDQFPSGKDLREPIQFTGFYFKNQVVTDGDDLFVAPTLLAKTINSQANRSGGNSVSPTKEAGQGGGARLAAQAQGFKASANSNSAVVSISEADRIAPQKRLRRAGVDESQLRRLSDGQPPNLDEQEILLKLLYHVRRFNLEELDRWTQHGLNWSDLSDEPETVRGQLFELKGRARQVTVEHPPQEVVARYELEKYYRCRIELSDPKRTAWVFTPRIPKAWNLEQPLDEQIAAQALFMKVGSREGDQPELVFVAPRLAWHPDGASQSTQARAPSADVVDFDPVVPNQGQILLGSLGMDVALWDDVRQPSQFSSKDNEAFYQLFRAVDRVTNQDLEQAARTNLQHLAGVWRRQYDEGLKQLKSRAENKTKANQVDKAASKSSGSNRKDKLTRNVALARNSYDAAQQGRYPIVRLFNLPRTEIGQLVLIEGIARRAVKVRTDDQLADGGSYVERRFGLDHYWEINLFTRDSKDNPVTFCARELPAGFPTGDDINEPVRVVGFFFKSWAYRRQRTATEQASAVESVEESGRESKSQNMSQLAPVIVGKQPIWLTPVRVQSNPAWGLLGAGLFALLLAVIAIWVWRNNIRDTQFERDVLTDRYRGDSTSDLEHMAILEQVSKNDPADEGERGDQLRVD